MLFHFVLINYTRAVMLHHSVWNMCVEMDGIAVRMWYFLPLAFIVCKWVSLPVICCGNNFWCESLKLGALFYHCVGNVMNKWKIIEDFEQKHMKQAKNSFHYDIVCFLGEKSCYVGNIIKDNIYFYMGCFWY